MMTVVLLGATVYISSLLSSTSSPTQIQKTKAAAVTYTRKVDLFQTDVTSDPTLSVTPAIPISPGADLNQATGGVVPTIPEAVPTKLPVPTLIAMAPTGVVPTKIPVVPTLLAMAPTLVPTIIPTVIPTKILAQVTVPVVSTVPATPTLQPLLAYKSTTISPTLIPIANTGGMANPTGSVGSTNPTKMLSPTIQKTQPTGVQQLPETGWIQTSSILFIVATSTILFSLLF